MMWVLPLFVVCDSWAAPMGTAFTYQGRLIDANNAADGLYDLQCKLYDANVGGTQKGSTIDINELDVIDGLFTVLLDFGSGVFDGNTVWLEIGVRAGELKDPNAYTTLSPRQEITPTPYALQTRGLFVDNALNVGIGTTSPASSLDVTNSGGKPAISGKSPWIGVWGIHNSTTGSFPGVWGDTDSLNSAASGVRGRVTSTTPGSLSAGVWGMNAGTGSNGVGVRGTHDGSGRGVWGHTASTTGYAGYFTGGQNYFEGSVGIGTLEPEAKLSIQMRSATPPYALNHPGLIIYGGSYNIGNRLEVQGFQGSSPYTIFVVKGAGYVGIRTTDPSSPLEVDGTVYSSSGGFKFPDNTVQTTAAGSGAAYWKKLGDSIITTNAGNVGIGNVGVPTKKLTVRGNILLLSESTGADVMELGEGLDYAEGFDVTDKGDIAPGAVLVIDPDNPGKLTVSHSAYDSKVAGIVAGGKGLGSGVRLGVGQFDYNVALAGRVYCNVDARENGVEPGDLLTTSATPGYAMKAVEYMRAQGAILGKAMERLEKGQKGQILVLVTLQ